MQPGRRNYSKDFKLQVIREIEAGTKTAAQASREYQIKDNLIYSWLSQYRKNSNNAFVGKGNIGSSEAKIAELERLVGRLTMENELLKKALAQIKGVVR